MSRRMFAAGLVVVLGVAIAAPARAAGPADKPQPHLYASEAEATSACGQDVVVWANKSSRIYHFKPSKWYGRTKEGAYGCRLEVDQAGYHAAKTQR